MDLYQVLKSGMDGTSACAEYTLNVYLVNFIALLPLGYTGRMDEMQTIYEVRRANLAAVIVSHWGGVAASLAKTLKCEKTVLSRIASKTKTRRNMGAGLARRIEIASKLQSGWMDTAHDGKAPESTDYAQALAEQISKLPVADQQMIELLVAHAMRRQDL